MTHVAVNAAFLDPGRSSGTETFLRGLVPEVARRVDRVTVLTTRRGARALVADGWTDFAEVVALPADEGQRLRRLRAELVGVARAAAVRGADVLHSIANTGPSSSRVPHVLTVHDVNWLTTPTLPLTTRLALRAIVGPAARRARAVTTVSEAVRAQVEAALGVRGVIAIPNGAGRPPGGPAADARAALGLPRDARVVACVGVLREHKNQGLLVRALDHLPHDVWLVLAGAHEAYARELPEHPRVRMPGYVADDVLEGLWATAACAAFPTRDEGFGLPVLEAMARGVPVACSDLPVLREVGGDLPRYFDPDDPADAARAIAEAMGASGTVGVDQADRFTWAAAADRYVEVYERACA